MTVPSEVSKSGPYTGNGVTVIFDYDFKIDDESHIHVIKNIDGVEVSLDLGDDYTVDGVGDPAGGYVTTILAPTNSQTITLLRSVPFTQETDLENQGSYYAETVERALDLGAQRDQQIFELAGRALTQRVSTGEYDAQGTGITNLRKGVNPSDAVNFEQLTEALLPISDNVAVAVAAATSAAASELATDADRIAAEVAAAAAAASAAAAGAAAAAAITDTAQVANFNPQWTTPNVNVRPASQTPDNPGAPADPSPATQPAPVQITDLRRKMRALTVFDFLSSGAIKTRIENIDGAPDEDDAPDVEKAIYAAQARRAENGGKWEFNTGCFPVRSLQLGAPLQVAAENPAAGTFQLIEGNAARIYGVTRTYQSGIVKIDKLRHFRLQNLEIVTDGDGRFGGGTSRHHQHYGCGLHIYSTEQNVPTQYGIIDNIFIRYIRNGIVYGNLIGDPAGPQRRRAQSEITIRNCRSLGVKRCYYHNGHSAIVRLSGNIWAPVRPTAMLASAWATPDRDMGIAAWTGPSLPEVEYPVRGVWQEADVPWCGVHCDEGQLSSEGDEYYVVPTKPVAEGGGYEVGYAAFGREMSLVNPIFESGMAPIGATGDVTILGSVAGFIGAYGGRPVIKGVGGAGARGDVYVTGMRLRRREEDAGIDAGLIADMTATPNLGLHLDNCTIHYQPFEVNNQSSELYRAGGGEVTVRNFRFDNKPPEDVATDNDWFFQGGPNVLLAVDLTGYTMSTTLDLTAKGFWTGVGSGAGNGFRRSGTSPPPGHTEFIELVSADGTQVEMVSPASPVSTAAMKLQGGRDYLLHVWMKALSAFTGTFRMQVVYFDVGGTIVGATQTIFQASYARLNLDGFTDWRMRAVALKVPKVAAYGRIYCQAGPAANGTCHVGLSFAGGVR